MARASRSATAGGTATVIGTGTGTRIIINSRARKSGTTPEVVSLEVASKGSRMRDPFFSNGRLRLVYRPQALQRTNTAM
jgi:hypothetical protein